MPWVRRFSTSSEAALQADAVQTAGRVLGLLAAFRAALPAPVTGMAVEAYRKELHGLLEQLEHDERRLEDLADELILRGHWRTLRDR
ncbi:MAG TPA: hypothetical protein VK939_17000 [Longimicrobiales bacterium]|nr:hypothetical protein [Longimicrobiales bacterium]